MTPRARTAMGLGALSTALAAGSAAVAQAPAQAQTPAAPPAAAAAASASPATAAPTRTRTALRVTARRLNVRAGRRARVSGRLTPAAAGRVVTLQRRGARRWVTIDRDRTDAAGRFTLSRRMRGADTSFVRVRFGGDPQARPARRPLGRLNVFRPALASWYGPGLYGNPLGCGGRLGAGTVGVAHKSLPCGKRVVLRKGNRVVSARVIDRGPYAGDREFDLTSATKSKLGFSGVGTVQVAH